MLQKNETVLFVVIDCQSLVRCQSFIPDPWFFPGNQHHKYIYCCDYLLAEQYYYSLWVESIGKGVVLSGIDNIKKSVWKQEALKKNKQTKEKETLGMLLTVIESVEKSIEGAGKSIYDPLAIHCLVVIAKYWFLPVREESVNLPFSREELCINLPADKWRSINNCFILAP